MLTCETEHGLLGTWSLPGRLEQTSKPCLRCRRGMNQQDRGEQEGRAGPCSELCTVYWGQGGAPEGSHWTAGRAWHFGKTALEVTWRMDLNGVHEAARPSWRQLQWAWDERGDSWYQLETNGQQVEEKVIAIMTHRGMQIKITRPHLTLVRMLIIQRTRDNSTGKDMVGGWTGAATVEDSMEVLQKLENKTTIWSSIPVSGYMAKQNENRISKTSLHSQVHCSSIHRSQDVK